MNQQPEPLLERDHIEEVLDEAGPPPPVVVVQYRKPIAPWVLVAALVGAALILGGMLARNRSQTERFRQQALDARSDVERLKEQARTKDAWPRPPADRSREVQLAMAKGQGAADSVPERPVPASGAAAARVSPPGSPPPERPTAARLAATEAAPPSSAPDPAPAGVRSPAQSDPARPPGAAAPAPATATATAKPPVPVPPQPQPSQPPKHRIVTLPAAAEDPSPFEEAPGSVGVDGVAGRPGPAAPPAAPALPTREETERQIQQEAARMRRETNERLNQQQRDLQTLREDERQQFLAELRTTLQIHGRKAGPEIEKLSLRAGRDEDPVKLRQAYRVIGASRQTQRTKVHQLREIGVTESVILDYLANELERERGARHGPRSRNEVWIQAAQRLLSYELPPPRPGQVPPAPVRSLHRPTAARPAGDSRRTP